MISLPANYNDEVKPLPDGQHPFDVAGVTCKLSREVQAFLFHYGLGCEAADIMVTEDLVEMRDIALADPDGNAEQKDYYSGSVHLMMPRRKHQELIRMAFRRMLSPNPYAAVVPPPRVIPSDDRAPASGNSAPSSGGAAASSANAPPNNSARSSAAASSSSSSGGKGKPSLSSSLKGKTAIKRSSAVAFDTTDESERDGDDGDDSDSADGDVSARRSSRLPEDLNSLVNELGDEVCCTVQIDRLTWL